MDNTLLAQLESHQSSIAIIGLGYVGLPIAITFAKKYKVTGFDINKRRIQDLKKGIDPNGEYEQEALACENLSYTATKEDIKEAIVYIITVPTPVDDHNTPDLTALKSACSSLGSLLTKNNWVIFESTVFPGCTEEVCIPIIEEVTGLKWQKDFFVGYSPERVNPGDKTNTIDTISKIVAAHNEEDCVPITALYQSVIKAPIFTASTIKVAEAAKLVENTQRDVNIALMNELSLIFKKMDINTFEVLEAAGTKWNFINFHPGLVGGHCISVDPYYLTYKASKLGYYPRVILSGRNVNNAITAEIAKEILQYFIKKEKILSKSRVLVMGITFKENVSDTRDSKVAQLVSELKEYQLCIDIVDPKANNEEVKQYYGFELTKEIKGRYDAIIMAVGHKEFTALEEDYFLTIAAPDAIFYDVKGVFRNKIKKIQYTSL